MSLHAPPSPIVSYYFPSLNNPRTLHLLAPNKAHQMISETYFTRAWRKVSYPSSSYCHTPPCSAMKWHPYLINCESWNFAQETSFLCTWQWLNCTAMQFHSPRQWEEKGAEGRGHISVQSACEWGMTAISLWHHEAPLNGAATQGPFYASRLRGLSAQWGPIGVQEAGFGGLGVLYVWFWRQTFYIGQNRPLIYIYVKNHGFSLLH